MMRRIGAWMLAAVVALLALGAWWFLSDPASTFSEAGPSDAVAAQVDKGAYLARAGNCMACHTSPGGEPYAGGRPIETPFGTVYSSNLTPDRSHGIGTWTSVDFWRALHEGRAPDGRLLYPAFPYTSYHPGQPAGCRCVVCLSAQPGASGAGQSSARDALAL